MIFKRPAPIEDEIAVVHSPAGIAATRKRCEKIRDELDVDGQAKILDPVPDLYAALAPLKFGGSPVRPTEVELRAAGAAARSNLDALLLREIMVREQARETQAIVNDPDRMEYHRILAAWEHQVNAIAFTHGDRINGFVGRVRGLIRQRDEAEVFDDEAAVRSVESRLNKLTGVPFPQLPEAAWEAADLLPASERQAELDRLEQKYGARNTASATNGNSKVRTLHKIRPQLTHAN
jgi:hypothetical protein